MNTFGICIEKKLSEIDLLEFKKYFVTIENFDTDEPNTTVSEQTTTTSENNETSTSTEDIVSNTDDVSNTTQTFQLSRQDRSYFPYLNVFDSRIKDLLYKNYGFDVTATNSDYDIFVPNKTIDISYSQWQNILNEVQMDFPTEVSNLNFDILAGGGPSDRTEGLQNIITYIYNSWVNENYPVIPSVQFSGLSLDSNSISSDQRWYYENIINKLHNVGVISSMVDLRPYTTKPVQYNFGHTDDQYDRSFQDILAVVNSNSNLYNTTDGKEFLNTNGFTNIDDFKTLSTYKKPYVLWQITNILMHDSLDDGTDDTLYETSNRLLFDFNDPFQNMSWDQRINFQIRQRVNHIEPNFINNVSTFNDIEFSKWLFDSFVKNNPDSNTNLIGNYILYSLSTDELQQYYDHFNEHKDNLDIDNELYLVENIYRKDAWPIKNFIGEEYDYNYRYDHWNSVGYYSYFNESEFEEIPVDQFSSPYNTFFESLNILQPTVEQLNSTFDGNEYKTILDSSFQSVLTETNNNIDLLKSTNVGYSPFFKFDNVTLNDIYNYYDSNDKQGAMNNVYYNKMYDNSKYKIQYIDPIFGDSRLTSNTYLPVDQDIIQRLQNNQAAGSSSLALPTAPTSNFPEESISSRIQSTQSVEEESNNEPGPDDTNDEPGPDDIVLDTNTNDEQLFDTGEVFIQDLSQDYKNKLQDVFDDLKNSSSKVWDKESLNRLMKNYLNKEKKTLEELAFFFNTTVKDIQKRLKTLRINDVKENFSTDWSNDTNIKARNSRRLYYLLRTGKIKSLHDCCRVFPVSSKTMDQYLTQHHIEYFTQERNSKQTNLLSRLRNFVKEGVLVLSHPKLNIIDSILEHKYFINKITVDFDNLPTQTRIMNRIDTESDPIDKVIKNMTPRDMVKTVVKKRIEPLVPWEFVFLDDIYNDQHITQAVVRISLDVNSGNWSFVGIDNFFTSSTSTMNISSLDSATIMHEFLHVLGMGHEHDGTHIKWNEDLLYNWTENIHNMDKEKTRKDIIEKYQYSHTNGQTFDPESIMLFYFPKELTTYSVGRLQNKRLSQNDVRYIMDKFNHTKDWKDVYHRMYGTVPFSYNICTMKLLINIIILGLCIKLVLSFGNNIWMIVLVILSFGILTFFNVLF